ncbi:unnamed protein product [Spodoptera exigua]|nr:unnamed protein product [Spodoptera exigua]
MSAPLNWHKWLVLSLLGLALSARTIGCDYSSITEKFGAEAVARCNEKCPFQNRTGNDHFDVSCGSDCSLQQNVTSETVFSRELYCVMGCNEALNTYFQKLRELIGIPTAPALVADSLTATSLSLVWEAPNLGNLSYMVQWRYEELPGTWQYYSNSSHSDQSIIHVDGLRPYTKYRFRVAIFLSGRGGTGEPVYSAPSVVISTLESGKPSSAPTSLRAAAPDPSRVAISWEPGPFPNGPWSSEFVGKTLASSPNTLHSTLLWSGPDGLLQTDLTGDNLQILIHRGLLKNLHITDISWYRDLLYLVTNASTVMWYNTTTHKRGLMSNMDNVGSLAVDWVGKKIYWSNPKQQLITRGNLDGGNREPVPIVTVAKELTIDSLGAYIYWNTGHAVEAARLNGENKMIYYPAQLFSGKQVMGLTADLEEKWLYWLVRSYDGSELHRAPTADQITHGISEVCLSFHFLIKHFNLHLFSSKVSGSLVTRLSGTATLGPLCYFSGRLVWVQDASRAVVSDLAGRYTADLVPRVHVIAVRDPTLHANSESLIAIPETINPSSITVAGEWDRFNVTWDPATRVNVNNSKVYYDVSLHFPGQYKIEKTVEESWLEVVSVSVAPYSSMEATVRAHTHWGGGPAARAALRSPQAPPSAPRAPRIYVQPAISGGPQSAIFRWGSPARANGVIRGYEAQCWVVGADSSSPTKPSACADAHLSPSHTQLMLRNLTPASKYFFQVRAHTDAGYGQYSEVVSASSDDVNPIPKVMVSSQESIKIIDLDSGESETIPKSTGIPVDFAVSTEENIVYWVNNLEEIFSARINGSGHFKLTSINGSASSMCVDWVSRSVYWTQLEITSVESYVTYRADLGMPNTRPHITRVFARKQPIYSLQIAPLHRTLFWYEEIGHPGLGTIMTSHLNGSDIKPFFRNSETSGRECNCPENPQVAKAFVIDMTRSKNYDLYWVDPWLHHIIATDMDACKCRVVVDATEKKKYGFTPMSITVDSRYVYWFNSTQKEIFYTTKHHKTRIEERKTAYGYKIMALDSGNQPYPPRLCLFPKILMLRPKLISNSANSITLHMPYVEKPNRCHSLEYEMSTTEYTIFYRIQLRNDTSLCDKESCSFVTTTNTKVVINDLKPFTNYTVMLEATNYYAKLHEVKPLVGTPMIIQTAAEAPTAPKDVTGMVLSPVLAYVEWKPDPGLSYEVHWRTDDSSSLAHKLIKEHNTFEVSSDRAANITRLSPGTAYVVWVRARSRHSAVWADSAPLRLRTFPPPAALALRATTPTHIRLLWPPPTTYQLHQFRVEYMEASPTSSTWKPCTRDERNEWVATDLRPLTRYRFRLRLQYVASAPPYYWPHDDRFTFGTLGDVPGAPGPLRVESFRNGVLQVKWNEPDSRGSPILSYRVWGRPQHRISQGNENITKNLSELLPANLPSDIDDKMKMRVVREGWELLHNCTETFWLLSSEGAGAGGGAGAGAGAGWVARVQARNAYGWGALSPAADLDAAAAAPQRPPAAALALALLAALAALLAVAAAVFYAYNARARKKAAVANQIPTNPARRGPDVELATLRQLPTRHSTNILYNQGVHCPTDAELASLPHIRREQITLTKFLGSGAFGEVFEGVARQINGSTADTKVAVKTLRKSATEQEKTEFLKEAALMSNFKHEHILRLLGVCLDNDPNYIIMELMEGGDLLSYLRAKRASLYTPESLTLLDLLNMCVDVTKGCRYLEEMHFVHRDLACRNCLVAHRANGRVVKIGDFGLARDIYKNDYYRKEGEGLLPVRWMAVECLVDGVFSCQSDVWAWGVLCWEILSLGQQPYPACTNRQVLAYVRSGGTPDRPPNCPSALYELLQKCWSYAAEARPSFRQCLQLVTALRDKTSPNITLTATPSPAPHYLTLLPDDEDFPDHMEPSRLLPERTPKYLELMYDSDSAQGTICDGYEIPRAPITYMPPFSRHSIVGVAPNRLIKPPLYRTHSLRTQSRPPNATIIPLRNGLVKRASLCEEIRARDPRPTSSREQPRVDLDFDKHVFKTPF